MADLPTLDDRARTEVELARHPELRRLLERRAFLKGASAGTVIAAMGGLYAVTNYSGEALAEGRSDGRTRVPPGQRVLERLKPMGGEAGDPRISQFRLKVHGAVAKPFELDFPELVQVGAVARVVDVHCVTGWSVLGAKFYGVPMRTLIERANPKPEGRYVVFEAAHGYTANVPLREVLSDDNLVTWQLDGERLTQPHGGPVRGLVPNLYFWKSVKWITGIRVVEEDEPGYWETRGYHNHANPWREERYG